MTPKERLCIECGITQPIENFEMVDYDSENECYVHSDRCASCTENLAPEEIDEPEEHEDWDEEDERAEYLAKRLAAAAQMNQKILASYTEQKFVEKAKIATLAGLNFAAIKKKAAEYIANCMGTSHVKRLSKGPGTYIVIGDSEGIWCEDGIIECVRRMAEKLDAEVIHVGHMVDRQKNLPQSILRLNRLTVIAMADEMPYLQERQRENPSFTLVRESIDICENVLIKNQNWRGNYTVSSSKGLRVDAEGREILVVNRHQHEMHALCRNDQNTILITVGDCCEPHKSRKPRKRIPKDEAEFIQLAQDATYGGRRQEEVSRYWENGLVVVHVRPDGGCTPVICRAKRVNGEFAVAYLDMIFTESGIREPDEIGLVVGDAHVDNHDPEVLDIVDQVAASLRRHLTFYVNLGDHMDMRSLNHHMLDRGEPTQVDVANECGKANYVLQMMAQWASERHIIIGNHGRFIEDFAKKNPQLLGLLNFHALSGAEMAGYNVLEEKAILSRGPSKFCHGEIRMFGATGDKHYKMQQVMQAETMFGHTHTPTCRCGCYSVGLLGQLDQDYNEVEASQWVHGFGLAYVYEGESFMTSIPILGHALTLGNRTFVPGTGVAKWVPPEFEAQVIYRQKI